jgi:hypothetical protein
MPQSIDEWSDQYWDRAFSRHTAQVETVKLVVTFSLAVAATLVASALQVAPATGWDIAASIVLGLAFISTLVTIQLDRLKWPTRREVLQKREDEGWTEVELLLYLPRLYRDTEEWNDRVVGFVRRSAEYQLLLAAATGTLAVVSLFR